MLIIIHIFCQEVSQNLSFVAFFLIKSNRLSNAQAIEKNNIVICAHQECMQ